MWAVQQTLLRMPLIGTCCRYEALHSQHMFSWVSSMVCIYFMSSLVRHDRWELQHGLALNLFNTILTFVSVHRVSCPRSYVTKDGSYSMVWLSIRSILSSHSWVSIMFHVLARTSRHMGATAWSGSQSVQYHPHIHECPSCFMSSLVRHERWDLQHGLALF